MITKLYKEDIIDYKTALNELSSFLQTKININDFKKIERDLPYNPEISYKYKYSNDKYYSITYLYDAKEVALYFEDKIILKETSLADPLKKYQTTSASIINYRTKKLKKSYYSVELALKAINKFFENS